MNRKTKWAVALLALSAIGYISRRKDWRSRILQNP